MSAIDKLIAANTDLFRSITNTSEALLESDDELSQALAEDARLLGRADRHIATPPQPHEEAIQFNPLLAEILLRDGAVLLDRALQARKEHQDLITRFFETRIQIDELLTLHSITRKEEQLYDQVVNIRSLEAAAESETKRKAADCIAAVTSAQEALGKSQDSLIRAVCGAAYAPAAMTYKDAEVGPYGENEIDKRPVSNHVYRGAYYSTKHALSAEGSDLSAKLAGYQGVQDSADKRSAAISANAELQREQNYLQLRRNAVARFVALRRARALVDPEGELNFCERAKPVLDRFKADTTAAYIRLRAAAQGMSKLYNYPDRFPHREPEVDFDAIVHWCQSATTWMAAFSDIQQICTFSISLVDVVGQEKFRDGVKAGRWEFTLGTNHFGDRESLRMRALSANVATNGTGAAYWNARFSVPTRPLPGEVFVGKVTQRGSPVPSEVASPARLHNVSPIGTWTLLVYKAGVGKGQEDLSPVTDVDLHLTVAFV